MVGRDKPTQRRSLSRMKPKGFSDAPVVPVHADNGQLARWHMLDLIAHRRGDSIDASVISLGCSAFFCLAARVALTKKHRRPTCGLKMPQDMVGSATWTPKAIRSAVGLAITEFGSGIADNIAM